MNLPLQIFAAGVAVFVVFATRQWVGLPLWVCALAALVAYSIALLSAAFLFWARIEHRYHRLEIAPEDDQQNNIDWG